MAEVTYAEPTTQVIPDIDYSPRTSGTLTPLDNNSNRDVNGTGGVGIDGRSPQRAPVSATPDIIDAEWRDITPEPFQSTSEWSAQQRAKWRAEDEQRIQQARQEADAYDKQIRDIDAATPKKGNRNPASIGRAVASASAGVTGVMEAIDRRGNGAGWGETIGAGIGAVAGSLAGTAAGSAAGASAGAATTANPVGAKVGLGIGAVLGEQVGGAIGAEIGGLLLSVR